MLWLLACLLLGLLLYFAEAWPSPRRYWLVSKLPGPPGVFYLGNAWAFSMVPTEDILSWLMDVMKDFPRMMRLWILGASHVYIYDPDDLQVVLSSVEHIPKGYEYEPLRPWLQEGLLTSSGTKWHGRRKMLTPAFHFKILEESMTTFNKNSKLFAKKLKDLNGEAVECQKLITLCTLDVICEAAMGYYVGAQENKGKDYVTETQRISELITHRATSFWLFKEWIFNLSSVGKEFSKTLQFLHNYTDKVISERKNTFCLLQNPEEKKRSKNRKAFLDALLEEEARNPGSLTNLDIREEVDTFMFEGHDTTSQALNFIFFNLASHPDIQERLFEEVEEVLPEVDEDLTPKHLAKMSYLERVIKESLRIFPSVPYISRLIEKDITLSDGTVIPAPSNVVMMPYKIHRNEEIFPDPERFDPDRFTEDECQRRHPFAYIPFSAGPRNCIGQKFAMMELKSVVATVVRSFRIEQVTRREDFKLIPLLVLRTTAPIKCKFIPR